MKSVFATLTVAIALTGCSGKSGGGSGEKGWTTTNTADKIVPLTKQDEFCSSTRSNDEEASFAIQQFINGNRVFRTYTFDNQLDRNYVLSKDLGAIKKTEYGKNTSLIINLHWNEAAQEYAIKTEDDFNYEQLGKLQKLDICPSFQSMVNLPMKVWG